MYSINIVVITQTMDGDIEVKITNGMILPSGSGTRDEQIEEYIRNAIPKDRKIVAFSHTVFPEQPRARS